MLYVYKAYVISAHTRRNKWYPFADYIDTSTFFRVLCMEKFFFYFSFSFVFIQSHLPMSVVIGIVSHFYTPFVFHYLLLCIVYVCVSRCLLRCLYGLPAMIQGLLFSCT